MLSLYGICLCLQFNVNTTLPNADRLELILIASWNLSPSVIPLSCLSEPAKSTIVNTPIILLLLLWSLHCWFILILNILWDRDEYLLTAVSCVSLNKNPDLAISNTSFTELTGIDVNPLTYITPSLVSLISNDCVL